MPLFDDKLSKVTGGRSLSPVQFDIEDEQVQVMIVFAGKVIVQIKDVIGYTTEVSL